MNTSKSKEIITNNNDLLQFIIMKIFNILSIRTLDATLDITINNLAIWNNWPNILSVVLWNQKTPTQAQTHPLHNYKWFKIHERAFLIKSKFKWHALFCIFWLHCGKIDDNCHNFWFLCKIQYFWNALFIFITSVLVPHSH